MTGSAHRTLGAVSPDDFVRLAQLRRMQKIALALLAVMAVIFAVSFALQDRYPWLGYVRAASEGGMVGGLADWFAVTALFRYPLGIRVPHTNLIARRKDDIGEGLGAFIEENFLADDVVHDKLSQISGARAAGDWLQDESNASHLCELAASAGVGLLTVLDDADVQELLEALARRHLLDPEWGPLSGRALTALVEGEHHQAVIDIAADHLEDWLREHPQAFHRMVSSRLPTWMPRIVDRFVDQRLHTESVRWAAAVAADRNHPFREAIGRFLADLARDLQHDAPLQSQLEHLKHEVFDSPRVRMLAAKVWTSAREALVEMLQDPRSDLRVRMLRAAQDLGSRLREDPTLQYKVDVWVMSVVEHLIERYRHDLASVVTETVQQWDAREAAEKIELQVGKDLQFIRINGTVVGSLAGVAIYAIATLLIAPLTAA